MSKAKEKNQKAQELGNVTVEFLNIRVEHVPFCRKTIRVEFQLDKTQKSTPSMQIQDFCVAYDEPVVLQIPVNKEESGIIYITVWSEDLSGKKKHIVAKGDVCLTNIIKSNKKRYVLPLTSTVLIENLIFDVDIKDEHMIYSPVVKKRSVNISLPDVNISCSNCMRSFSIPDDIIENYAREFASKLLEESTTL